MIKKLDDELYNIVCGWWKSHGMESFPRDMLPDDSYVIFDNNPILAVFLYRESIAKFGMIGWVVSNPNSTKKQRHDCLDIGMDHLYEKAREHGLRAIFTFMKHDYLVEKLKDDGFVELSNDSIQLLKVL